MRNPKWHRDEIILALDLYFDLDRGPIDSSNPKVIALSKLLNKLPLFKEKPDKEKFRNANGVTLKLSNFKAIDPTYAGKGMGSYSALDKIVFEEFSGNITLLHEIATNIKRVANDPKIASAIYQIEDDESVIGSGVMEGEILYKLHKTRERNRKLVALKKQQVLEKTGSLKCEACTFDFLLFYGSIGKGFIECHHLIPLSSYKVSRPTDLKDLALLCANCHRMIHKNMETRTIEEFKAEWGKM